MPFDGTNFAPRSPVAADLWRAADILQQRGWCQGSAGIGECEDEGAAVCIIGAVFLAVAGKPCADPSFVGPHMHRLRASLGMSPAAWNDTICTSKEQAVATLRRAALTVEAAHAV